MATHTNRRLYKGRIRVVHLPDGAEVTHSTHGSPAQAVAFSPDGTLLATACDDGNVRVIHLPDGTEISRITHDSPAQAVALSPDGTLLATASRDGSTRVNLHRAQDLIDLPLARRSRDLTSQEWL